MNYKRIIIYLFVFVAGFYCLKIYDDFANSAKDQPAVNKNESRLQAKKGWALINTSAYGLGNSAYVLTFFKDGELLVNDGNSQVIREYTLINDSLIKTSLSYAGAKIYIIHWQGDGEFTLTNRNNSFVFKAVRDDYNPIVGF